MDNDLGPEINLVQQGFRQARIKDGIRNLRYLLYLFEFSSIVTPILLALILWRVW